jgi:hypothetical protein
MKNTYIMMLTKKVDRMKAIDPNYYQWIWKVNLGKKNKGSWVVKDLWALEE